MKKLLFAAMLLMCVTVYSQNAKIDSKGNYIAVTTTKESGGKPTGKTFTDAKGIVYPVMVSKNGKLYYTKISKNGNEYKVYLKL